MIDSIWRSIAFKLAVIVIGFAAVPAFIYEQLRAADEARNALLLEGIVEQGHLIARGLEPLVERFDSRTAATVNAHLARLGQRPLNVKVLFRPETGANRGAFFFVASAPAVEVDYLQRERGELDRLGVFDLLSGSCEGDRPLAHRFTNPRGQPETLTSLSATRTRDGCWIVVSSLSASNAPTSLGVPYWKTPAMRWAAAIYVGLALVVIALVVALWRNIERFARLAEAIRTADDGAQRFETLNRIPELDRVAAEFDRLVDALRASGRAVRRAAEENVHAFKAPIGVIAQSLEPLRAALGHEDARSQRALKRIVDALGRLDGMVTAARRLDEEVAESIALSVRPLDLSALVERIVTAYSDGLASDKTRIERAINAGLRVRANDQAIETIIENLLDNAVDFSPAGGTLIAELRRGPGVAVLSIADEGPGVPPIKLSQIFERYYSHRTTGAADEDTHRAHFGIGLWIVRRNAEAMGGRAYAENRTPHGLRVVVELPLVR